MTLRATFESLRAFRRPLALLAAPLLVLTMATPAASAATPDKQPMRDFVTSEAITGTFSMLTRSEDAVATKIRTSATPGDAFTFWYVIFNAPENCSDDACGEDDIFVDGDMSKGFDEGQIVATRLSVVYGGDGDIANSGGRLALDGGLAEGDVPDGTNQVVIGHPDDGALVPLSPVTGLEDAQTAEIHIVLQSHGAAHEDPELLEQQLTQFEGACNPDCVDPQFAVHK